MMKIPLESLLKRFEEYVKIDTQADPESLTVPSSLKQKDLSRLLFEQCKELNLEEVEMTEEGYVYATVPSNSQKKNIPTICFCAHVDTAPDCSGKDVKPIVHRNYQGQPIVLPDDNEEVIRVENFPILKQHLGEDIITASGTTLLGADDKSGVAIIMETARYLQEHDHIPHGKIRLFFTTDEEVGRGVDHVDMSQLNADFGYTLDGGRKGSFENETFSADAATLIIEGKSAHPGYAKGHMEHSMKIAARIIAAMPTDHLTPESTEGRQGFVHPVKIEGELEKTVVQWIVRDFQTDKLAEHVNVLRDVVERVMKDYGSSTYRLEINEQYRNMREILDLHPEVSEYAMRAIEKAGMEVYQQPIRGGTDGSRLSFMGLPCANIFTGMHGIHSRQEWISLQDMGRSVETLLCLVEIWEQEA